MSGDSYKPKKIDVNYIGMTDEKMGSGIVEQSSKHIFNQNSAMDEAYSSEDELESQDVIDVIGQGQLNEVCQQRGDEDSRRYRVFQHYLRTSG